MITQLKYKADNLGMISSTICMIHCILTPFLFTIKACSVNGCCSESPLWWGSIDFLFLIISLYAVVKSYQNSSNGLIKGILIFSWLFLAFVVVNDYLQFIKLWQYMIYIPAFLLVAGHYINRKYYTCEASCCN